MTPSTMTIDSRVMLLAQRIISCETFSGSSRRTPWMVQNRCRRTMKIIFAPVCRVIVISGAYETRERSERTERPEVVDARTEDDTVAFVPVRNVTDAVELPI